MTLWKSWRAHCGRQDIAAIEARNNRLERQARHNSALLAAVEQLLGRLVLPPQTERVLASANFTYAMWARSPPICLLPLYQEYKLWHI
jgi:hypothetical protein